MAARAESRRWKTGPCSVLLASLLLSVAFASHAAAPPGGDWRERALAYAEAQHMFGPMQVLGQSYSGSFVRFQFDGATTTITDYTVVARSVSTAVFQSVAPEVVAVGSASLNGTLFEYSSAAFTILSLNNPTSGLVVRPISAAMNVTFTLSPGVDASRNGQSLNLSTPDLDARLAVTGAATLNLVGFQAVAHLPPGTMAFFRANSVAGENAVGPAGQTALAGAAFSGSLALESFSVGFEGYVESSDVRYDSTSLQDFNLTANGFTVDVEATQTTPKLVALHVHRSVIAYDSNSSYEVRLDGANLPKSASLDDLIADVGTSPRYAMVSGENGTLFLLRITGPGSHLFSVQKVLQPPTEQGLNSIQLLAIVAIIIVLLGAAAAFMLRRKPA